MTGVPISKDTSHSSFKHCYMVAVRGIQVTWGKKIADELQIQNTG